MTFKHSFAHGPLRLAGVTAAALAATGARAQSLDYSALEALFGEPVTTSATGSPQRESSVPATMVIITAEEIRRSGARDIPDVLRDVAGVDVLRWGANHSDVAIRGYNQAFSPRLLVLIDGRQVYADYYGFTPWSTLPVELDAIRQIEVVKGPNSALFGFNAVGGVVNIITYDPLYDERRSVRVTAGTQDLVEASAVTTLDVGENAALLVSAGSRRADEFTAAAPGFAEGARDALALDLRWQALENVEAGFEATYAGADHLEIGPTYATSFSEYDVKSLKADVDADTSLGLVQAAVYHNELDGLARNFDGTFNLDIDNSVTVVQLADLFKIGTDHTLRASAEHRSASMGTAPIQGGEVRYDVVSVGAMWDWRVGPALSWTNAVRWDRLSLERVGQRPAGYGLTNEDWDRSLSEHGFNTGLVWSLGDFDSLRFMVGRGVQLPSLFNLGGGVFPVPPAGYVGGTPNLDPTYIFNYEAGWDHVLAALDGELRVSAYHGHTRHITAILGGSDFASGLVSTAANIGNSDATGLEVTADGRIEPGLRWSASYSFETIDDQFAPGFNLQTTLVNFEDTLPEHVLRASAGWTRGPWEVDAFLRYQSRSSGIRATITAGIVELMPLPDFVSLDARIAYRINERMVVSATARNLNHGRLRETSAAPVERTVLASVSFEL